MMQQPRAHHQWTLWLPVGLQACSASSSPHTGTQAKDETDHLEEAALIEKIVRLEDALRNANQRESEREAAREQERISERRKLDSDVSLAPGCADCVQQVDQGVGCTVPWVGEWPARRVQV